MERVADEGTNRQCSHREDSKDWAGVSWVMVGIGARSSECFDAELDLTEGCLAPSFCCTAQQSGSTTPRPGKKLHRSTSLFLSTIFLALSMEGGIQIWLNWMQKPHFILLILLRCGELFNTRSYIKDKGFPSASFVLSSKTLTVCVITRA